MSDSRWPVIERLASIAVAVAALSMAATVVVRAIRPPAGEGPPAGGGQEAKYVERWQSIADEGRPIGATSGAIHIVEFTDFECGACRAFHRQTLPRIRQTLGDSLRLTLVHLPLTNHKFAKGAADAAECAADQGRFQAFVDAIFATQDSLGLKPWQAYARDARLSNPRAFAECLARGARPEVARGRAIADSLGVRATPTVLVNGWLVPQPDETEVIRVARALAVGESPYPKQR
jgi:protein-disulfide isomerase